MLKNPKPQPPVIPPPPVPPHETGPDPGQTVDELIASLDPIPPGYSR